MAMWQTDTIRQMKKDLEHQLEAAENMARFDKTRAGLHAKSARMIRYNLDYKIHLREGDRQQLVSLKKEARALMRTKDRSPEQEERMNFLFAAIGRMTLEIEAM